MSETNGGRRPSSLLAAVSTLGLALGVAQAAQAQVRKAGDRPVDYSVAKPGQGGAAGFVGQNGKEACAMKRGVSEDYDAQSTGGGRGKANVQDLSLGRGGTEQEAGAVADESLTARGAGRPEATNRKWDNITLGKGPAGSGC